VKENWPIARDFTLKHEGIRSNDSADPGGDTKWGIARNMHPEITETQWENWTFEDSVNKLKSDYWDAMGCDDLPYPMDCGMFDTAVNPGPGAARSMKAACNGDFYTFMELRKAYYKRKVEEKPYKQKYLNGWLNRCNDAIKTFGEQNES